MPFIKQNEDPSTSEKMLGPKEKEEIIRALQLRSINDFITFEKEVVLLEGDASDTEKYPVFYLPSQPCFVMEARLRHEVDSTSGTVDIEKLTSGTAKRSGTSVLVGTFDISTGAGVTQTRSTTLAALSSINLVAGDALALKAGGTLTGASNITVGVLLGILLKDLPESFNI